MCIAEVFAPDFTMTVEQYALQLWSLPPGNVTDNAG